MTRAPSRSSLTTSNYNRSSLPDSMVKKKKQTEQVYTSDYKDVIWGGDVLTQVGPGSVSYDIGDIGQLNFDYDNELRDKYPALKDAWEHYNTVKQMCESKEKESDEN